MKFLNFIRNNFERVLAYDTEFHFDLTKTIPQKVLCFCYVDIFTGKKFQYWEYDQSISHPHFDFDKVLLVSYNAIAEIGSHLKQLHGKPRNVWDAYIETARLYKPMRSGKGAMTLLTTAEKYGIQDKMSAAEKERCLDLILRRNDYKDLPFKYSIKEQNEILDYCLADAELLRQVFIKQVCDIEEKCKLKTDQDFLDEVQRIMYRGYSIGCVAQVERNGIPIDLKLVNKFNDTWPHVKDNLVQEVNKEIDVFNEDLTFSHKKFDDLIIRNGLDLKWPRMKSGHFTTNKRIIKQHLEYEEIAKLNEIRTLQNMTKLTAYTPGQDGRTRTNMNMFGTVTGRASPSSAKFVFGASKWARNFIRPAYGTWLVYMDYKSQEPGVMGYLSGDKNLIEAYQSGDIYIHTAKLFGFWNESATDKQKDEIRDQFKVLYLANSYGQGPGSVAESLKCTLHEAKYLQKKYRETYSTYFKWIAGVVEHGLQRGYLSTVLGWQRHIKDLFQIKDGKKVDIRRSLLNWPIQSHGAEILRTALMDLTDNHIKVCATIHDAVLVEIPIPEFNEQIELAERIMIDASIKVVGGPIRVDKEIIKGNFIQLKNGKPNKDQILYDKIMGEIETYTRSRNNVHPQ